MASIKCKGDFVEIEEDKNLIFVHRSQVILALLPDENAVLIGVVNNKSPIIARPGKGGSADALLTQLENELVEGKR